MAEKSAQNKNQHVHRGSVNHEGGTGGDGEEDGRTEGRREGKRETLEQWGNAGRL